MNESSSVASWGFSKRGRTADHNPNSRKNAGRTALGSISSLVLHRSPVTNTQPPDLPRTGLLLHRSSGQLVLR
jgi:hypothetical protein